MDRRSDGTDRQTDRGGSRRSCGRGLLAPSLSGQGRIEVGRPGSSADHYLPSLPGREPSRALVGNVALGAESGGWQRGRRGTIPCDPTYERSLPPPLRRGVPGNKPPLLRGMHDLETSLTQRSAGLINLPYAEVCTT